MLWKQDIVPFRQNYKKGNKMNEFGLSYQQQWENACDRSDDFIRQENIIHRSDNPIETEKSFSPLDKEGEDDG